MKSEETHRLCRGELIRVDGDVAGRVVCWGGILWLTQTENPGDHLIPAGKAISIDRPGVVLISALEDSVCTIEGRMRASRSGWSLKPAVCRMARRAEEAVKKVLLT